MVDVLNRNHVTIKGEGEQVMMLAHGFGCEQSMWRYISPAFEKDYKLVLFDYTGSGSSDISAYDAVKYNRLEGYVEDVLDIISSLNLENIIFVGHSISSMIGLLASIKRPDVFKKLIMIGPSPCYLNSEGYHGGFDKSDIHDLLELMEMNFEGWASYMAPMAMEQPKDTPKVSDLENMFVSNNPKIARQFAEVTFFSDYRHVLTDVTVDSLILQCAHDSIVPFEVAEYLNNHLANNQLQVMDAKGHYPHISQPEETIAAIKAYLG